MKRQPFAITLVVAIVGSVGCSSSTSTQPPSDLDKMAAALEQPSSANAGSASQSKAGADKPLASADGAAQPAAEASNAPAASADPSLRSKRGFDLEDWSNEAAYVLVKADAAKTADALAQVWKGKVIKDVLGKPADENKNQMFVYQLAGHRWSVFACDGSQLEQLTAALSRDTDVLVAWNSDFNGWSGVALYRGGQEVEAIHWGDDGDKLGEDADASRWQTTAQISRKFEDIDLTDVFLFRSKLRKVTAQDLQKGESSIDDLFRQQDAYLPDMEQMPWVDYETKSITSPLAPAAFAAVHAVEVAGL